MFRYHSALKPLSQEWSLFHSRYVRCQIQSNNVDSSSAFWYKHVFRLPVKWKRASLLISQSLTVVFHPEREGLERSYVPEDILRLFYVWEVWRWLCLLRLLSIYQRRQKSMQLSFMNVFELSSCHKNHHLAFPKDLMFLYCLQPSDLYFLSL